MSYNNIFISVNAKRVVWLRWVLIIGFITFFGLINLGCEKDKTEKAEEEVYTKTKNRFKIYPTSNMYNFLQLDTQTGRVWKIQWNLESSKRFEKEVSLRILVDEDEELINGRFELYPTENIYTFLLSDKIDGRVWQLQWNFESEKNWIDRIY